MDQWIVSARFWIFAYIGLILSHSVKAQDQPAIDSRPQIYFPANSYSLGTDISYVRGFGKVADIGSISFAGNYFLFPNFSIGGELVGLGVSQPGDEALGVNISGSIRHHFFRWETGTLFIDGLFGPVEMSQPVPEGGTRFNFISRIGPGVMLNLKDHLFLTTGVRYWHLSNAQIEGVARNPAINGMQVYVGIVRSW